jgi:hypothetical protein
VAATTAEPCTSSCLSFAKAPGGTSKFNETLFLSNMVGESVASDTQARTNVKTITRTKDIQQVKWSNSTSPAAMIMYAVGVCVFVLYGAGLAKISSRSFNKFLKKTIHVSGESSTELESMGLSANANYCSSDEDDIYSDTELQDDI